MREDGLLKLCRLEDRQQPGFLPVQKLVVVAEPFASKVQTGVTRRYAAKGAQSDYSIVLMCWNLTELPEGVEYAVRENGLQYRIDVANPQYDSDGLEVTLVRLEELYDVAG